MKDYIINFYETIRIKILKKYIKINRGKKNSSLTGTNFTIISNNCWAGFIYQIFDLEYKSPTIGLFLMAEDYINFISNLKYYCKQELSFIKCKDSKWKNYLMSNKKFGKYPIGKIDNIEIHFLHYKNELEAREKWEKRVKRINYDNLIFKFCNQNMCDDEHIKKFFNLNLQNKIFFSNQKTEDTIISEDYIYIKQLVKTKSILTSYEPILKYKRFSIYKYLNKVGGKDE